MSVIKLEYEILISGIYPFEGSFEKSGFKIVKNVIDEKKFNELCKLSAVYISPFLGMCCYPDETGVSTYLTLQKTECIDFEYDDKKEYDVAFTNQYLQSLDLFDAIEKLEKTMVLEINNDIKFPIKIIRAYKPNGDFITMIGNFMKLNVPCLISNDQKQALEVMKRQNNRLNSGIAYEKVMELAQQNPYFNNALTMYQSSFSVSDYMVGFVLLVTALESLLSLSTYAKTEQCSECGQTKYKIRATVSENVSILLMDEDEKIKREIKKLYDKRSQFLHSGVRGISKNDERVTQEYVRKVLLMYWCVSMGKNSNEHDVIMAEILSQKFKDNFMYKNFLTGLDNTSFNEKRIKIIKDTLLHIFEKIK